MKVDELFILHQGNGFELYNMSQSEDSEVQFVSRTAQNNGVVGTVDRVEGTEPFAPGLISVALGGSVLSSFVQRKPFYTAFHVMVLEPRREMSFQEKLYYCMCIQGNRYRYSYGRQANRTLKDIDLPDRVPDWITSISTAPIETANPQRRNGLDTHGWGEFQVKELFDVEYGVNLELLNCELAGPEDTEAVNFVARTSQNNGVVARVKPIPGIVPQPAGLITCAGGGSVLSTFVQNKPFYSGRDLYLLIPKYQMSVYSKLFCCTVIERNKYRFSYGRQANKTMPDLLLKLPVEKDGSPDFAFMEAYVKALPYSDRI